MQRDVLIELRARVVEAKGADREIDRAVARWQGWTQHDDADDPVYGGTVSTWWAEPGREWSTCSVPPDYSRSVDDALALVGQVLPGFHANIQPWFYVDGERVTSRVTLVRPRWPDYRPSNNEWFDNYEAEAATAPLAIILATIDALLAQEAAHG